MALIVPICACRRCTCQCCPHTHGPQIDPDDLAGLPVMAIVHRVLRTVRGFSQAQIAEPLGLDPAYISRLESGKEHPGITTLGKLEYTYASLREPLDPIETRWMAIGAMSESVFPRWVANDPERSRVSEIRRSLSELLMRAYRAARARRSEKLSEDEIAREPYLLKYTLLISM